MSPSIEKTPSTTTSTPPPSSWARCEHLLELVQAVVAEGAQLGAREQAAVEDRGVVAGVDDHRVARRRAACRACRGWPGGRCVKTSASSVPIHSAISRSSSRCSGIVPLSRREPVRPGAVAVQRVLGALHHALVAGQAEVVVRAEHDPLGALHLDDRHRRRGEHVEVGQDVRLARRRAAPPRARGRGPWRRRRWRSACRVPSPVGVEVRAVSGGKRSEAVHRPALPPAC